MPCVYGRSHFHTKQIINVLKCSEARISNCCFVPEVFSPHPLIRVIISLFNGLHLTLPHCLFSLCSVCISYDTLFFLPSLSLLLFSFTLMPLFGLTFSLHSSFHFLLFYFHFSMPLCQLSLSLVVSKCLLLIAYLLLIILNVLSICSFFCGMTETISFFNYKESMMFFSVLFSQVFYLSFSFSILLCGPRVAL